MIIRVHEKSIPEWQKEYGDGNINTYEHSADGFFATERSPIGFAVLNNDVDMLEKLHAGTVTMPEKPARGWGEDIDAEPDKDGHYPYVYNFDDGFEQEFVKDWSRVVGEKNNEEALRKLLEYEPDFWLCDVDFSNAYHAGYDKKLLAQLLRNFAVLVDYDDEGRAYTGYEDVSIEEMLEFLED